MATSYSMTSKTQTEAKQGKCTLEFVNAIVLRSSSPNTLSPCLTPPCSRGKTHGGAAAGGAGALHQVSAHGRAGNRAQYEPQFSFYCFHQTIPKRSDLMQDFERLITVYQAFSRSWLH
jgi:hypothetical protein